MGKKEILCPGQRKKMDYIHLLEEAGTKCSVVLASDFGIF